MDNAKLLIVDDDTALNTLLQDVLRGAGAIPVSASSGEEALRLYHSVLPHLVLLDILMPGMDGVETCRRLRAISTVPILILTALSRNEQLVEGLAAGADDYVTKPFNTDVLLARCEALLRRAAWPAATAGEQPPQDGYHDDYLSVDPTKRQVTVARKPVSLSPLEYDLLLVLLENAGRVLSYKQILQRVWGFDRAMRPDYVHVYMTRLRKKIERDPRAPRYLHNEPKLGYRFVPQLVVAPWRQPPAA